MPSAEAAGMRPYGPYTLPPATVPEPDIEHLATSMVGPIDTSRPSNSDEPDKIVANVNGCRYDIYIDNREMLLG